MILSPPRPKAVPDWLRALTGELRPIFEDSPPLTLVYVFGSVARGTAGPASDLDLGLVFARRGDRACDHVGLLGELAARIEGAGGFSGVDLVVLESRSDPAGVLRGIHRGLPELLEAVRGSEAEGSLD